MTFGMQAWYESAEQTIIAERTLDAPKSDYVQMKQDQASSITEYGWADKTRTNVRIPIDKAMEIMVATAGKLPSTQPSTTRPSTTEPAAAQPSASLDATR
jgi:hypothetical protein